MDLVMITNLIDEKIRDEYGFGMDFDIWGDKMHIEYECTLLEVNKTKFIEKIEQLGAIKKGDYYQKDMFMILNL